MKVCYIFQDQYPWDIRVEKIVNSLSNFNIESHIVSRNRDGLPTYEKIKNNVFVHRLVCSKVSAINQLINTPAFFSPFWLFKIYSIVKKTKADLIIVRDLPLAPAALLVGRITSIPVFLDMAENYPAMLQDTWKYRGASVVDYFIRNPFLLKQLEKITLPLFDCVFVVSEHSGERIYKIGVKKTNIRLIGNTPVIKKNIVDKNVMDVEDKKQDDFVIVYVGGLEESRGLEVVIRALPVIKKKIPGIKFIIVGKGTSEKYLKRLSKKLQVEEATILKGWVDPEKVPVIINSADVCIIPHYVTEHTETTIPNKIFDYMLQSKPVVATNSKSLKEIINNCKCGMVYNDNNTVQLADIIISLSSSKKKRELFGVSGLKCVKNQYNWNKDEKILVESVLNIKKQLPQNKSKHQV